jgi:hypothetical protein
MTNEAKAQSPNTAPININLCLRKENIVVAHPWRQVRRNPTQQTLKCTKTYYKTNIY